MMIATLLENLTRRQSLALAFGAGALMTLGFAPLHYWPVLFISLPIFYLLMQAASTRAQALWRGFFFGYGYSMAGTWWIANALLVDADKFAWMLPFCVLGLSAVMALWFVLLAWAIHALRARMSPWLFALLWLLVEVARSLGMFGFPWNLVGYMALASAEFSQIASLVGVYGLSLLIVWLGLLPLYWLAPHTRRMRIVVSLVAAMLLSGSLGFGMIQLSQPTAMTSILLRLVQPNVPQEVKGTPAGQQVAITSLGDLTTQPPQGTRAPDIVIWPETAYPFTVRTGQAHPLPALKLLLTGAVRAQGYAPDTRIWNSLLAMDEGGQVLAQYDKHQLVPFGEFVPLRSVLPLDKITPGDIDFSRGNGPQTLSVEGIPPFSPLICYEVIFPWLAVDPAHRPAWMLNVTNDGWYGDSPGPYQHFDMARMRAIEQGLPLVRAANNGVSAVIDGRGRIMRSLSLNQKGYVDVTLPAANAATLYAKYYHFLIYFLLVNLTLCAVFLVIPKAKDK